MGWVIFSNCWTLTSLCHLKLIARGLGIAMKYGQIMFNIAATLFLKLSMHEKSYRPDKILKLLTFDIFLRPLPLRLESMSTHFTQVKASTDGRI
jgi:hypothetical protein